MKEFTPEISKIVVNVINEFSLTVEQIDTVEPDLGLLNHYGLTSLSMISLVIQLEESFDVKFDDEDLNVDNFGTVNKISELIEFGYR